MNVYRDSFCLPSRCCAAPGEDTLYFDIETTGLQRKNALVYLIGCAHLESTENGTDCWRLLQWFAENPDQESDILAAFSAYASSFRRITHFNGQRFDIPFVEYRCSLYQLSSPFTAMESRDLYLLYQPLKRLLALDGMKQKNLEDFLDIGRQDQLSGRECIAVYRDLIKYRDPGHARPLLLHNREDLSGLLQLECMDTYLQLLEGDFHLHHLQLSKDSLHAEIRVAHPFPRSFSNRSDLLEISGEGSQVSVRLPLHEGRLRNYYADYRNYYYLPDEDMAVHRSLGKYVSPSHRRPARPETCYTCFDPGEDFLRQNQKAEEYLRRNIPLLLSLGK